jgi:hypothetical protein
VASCHQVVYGVTAPIVPLALAVLDCLVGVVQVVVDRNVGVVRGGLMYRHYAAESAPSSDCLGKEHHLEALVVVEGLRLSWKAAAVDWGSL